MFRVHIGYTITGRNRWRKFATLAEASTYCDRVFRRRGVVLSIVRAEA